MLESSVVCCGEMLLLPCTSFHTLFTNLTLSVRHLPLLSAAAIVKERIVSLLKDVRIVEEEAMDTS